MNTSMDFTATIGLRQVLEDCVELLEGGQLDAGRKAFVLQDLVKFFEKVKQGSELVENQRLFLGNEEASAFETYTLVDRLSKSKKNGELKAQIVAVCQVLSAIREGKDKTISSFAREKSLAFLSEFLRSLRNEIAFSPPPAPIHIKIA